MTSSHFCPMALALVSVACAGSSYTNSEPRLSSEDVIDAGAAPASSQESGPLWGPEPSPNESTSGPSVLVDAGPPAVGESESCKSLKVYPKATASGGTLTPRPAEAALRLQFAYQGSRLLIVNAVGVNKVVPASSPALKAGYNSGYWFELRDAREKVIFTELVRDPSVLEGPGAGGGLVNVTIPRCDEKLLEVLLPNEPTAKSIVFFASDYGTQKAATERARFRL